MRHLLIASDGSDLARAAVAYGLALAKDLGAKVSIICVSESWTGLEIAAQVRIGIDDPIKRFEGLVKKAAEQVLAAAGRTAEHAGVAAELIHVPDSHPADGIIATAEEKGCDMIVMASHGRRGLKRVFLGSVASEVTARSTIPVLIFK